MYCILDTETSGLFDFSRPADAEGQPRLASIAMLLADDHLNLIASSSYLIRPDGWEMSAEAESVNGLSQALLNEHGVRIRPLLASYEHLLCEGYTIVAHNAQFDTKVMRGEMRRAGMIDLYDQTPTICTMKILTDVCRIPSRNGRGYKWPRLSEAISFCLQRDHVNAHGALPDAMGCLDLLRWIKAQGYPMIPSIGAATA